MQHMQKVNWLRHNGWDKAEQILPHDVQVRELGTGKSRLEVLTDGKIWVNHQGEIIKSFNNKDLGAIKELLAMGFQVHIVTASSWWMQVRVCCCAALAVCQAAVMSLV